MTAQHRETLARSAVYELLSMAFLYPREGINSSLEDGAAKLLGVASEMGWTDTGEALQTLLGELRLAGREGVESQYISVFGHLVSADCPPYEGEYGQAHVFQKSQTLSDLTTFYSAFGVMPSPDARERMDHISMEMEFVHLLTLKEAYACIRNHGDDKVVLCRQAQEGFLANHLANWIKSFTRRLEQKTSGRGIYGALARLLDTHMDREFARFRLDSTPADGPPDSAEHDEEPQCAAESIPFQTA